MPFPLTRRPPGKARSPYPAPGTTGSICRLSAPTRASHSTASASPEREHSRAASTATFCRPTRTMPSPQPTASTTCAAPLSSPPVRMQSKSPPVLTLRTRPCRCASTGIRRSSARPITKRQSPRQKRQRSRSSSSGRASLPSSVCPAIRTSSSKRLPPSIPTPLSCSTPASPSPCPGPTRSKAYLRCGGPATKAAGQRPICCLARPAPPAACPSPGRKSLTDYAATDPKYPERSSKGVDGKTTYSEGVNVGYRWFDKENIEPLFAFGHGLSYTTFAYSGLEGEKGCRRRARCHRQRSRTPAAWTPTKCRRFTSARPARFPPECSSLFARSSPSTA